MNDNTFLKLLYDNFIADVMGIGKANGKSLIPEYSFGENLVIYSREIK